MKDPRIALFAYDFPHKKTQDILTRLFFEGFNVWGIFAAPYTPLGIPEPSVRTKVRHSALLHPKKIAQRIGANYYVFPHESEHIVDLINKYKLDLGIIAGARILPEVIIDSFKCGIINFHPGLIPEIRGLDAMLWSIYWGVPLGVTAHIIDKRVDAGTIISREIIPIYYDDTLFDLSERLYEKQLEMISEAIVSVLTGKGYEAEISSPYNKKMSAELERRTVKMFPGYKRRYGSPKKIRG